MTNNTSAALNKKFGDNITVTDNFGNTYLFVRSGRAKGFFNIAKCEVFTDGHIDDNDGLVPDAVFYNNEEVAYLLAKSEEYQEQLAKAEASLKQWIDFREAWARKGTKKRKLSIQKQEVAK